MYSHSIIGNKNLDKMLRFRIIRYNNSDRFARMEEHVIHYLVETITHRLKQGSFHFRLMNQDFHQTTVYLLYVLIIEQLYACIPGLRKVLMK